MESDSTRSDWMNGRSLPCTTWRAGAPSQIRSISASTMLRSRPQRGILQPWFNEAFSVRRGRQERACATRWGMQRKRDR